MSRRLAWLTEGYESSDQEEPKVRVFTTPATRRVKPTTQSVILRPGDVIYQGWVRMVVLTKPDEDGFVDVMPSSGG